MSSYPYSDPTSWLACDTRLRHKTSRNPVSSRKIANNTWLQRRDNGDIAVKLHATDVVIFHHPNGPDGGRLSIFTGGWNTITTRDRINRVLPGQVSVFTHKRVAYVAMSREQGWNPSECVTLSEGFSIADDGTDPRHGEQTTELAPPRSQRDRGGWGSRAYLTTVTYPNWGSNTVAWTTPNAPSCFDGARCEGCQNCAPNTDADVKITDPWRAPTAAPYGA